jgi:SAM-dependent methyltransferase
MNDLTTPLPSEELIALVAGDTDRQWWGQTRLMTVEYIIEELKKLGIDYKNFQTIVDFGCGCGRVVAGWEWLLPKTTRLYGVDVNPTSIQFCQDNIKFAVSATIDSKPPMLIFGDAQCGFIYAASVFTHMTLEEARGWAAEFKRVIAPGGVAMISTHGEYYIPTLETLSATGVSTLRKDGFYCHLIGEASETFAGSNNYATFMTKEFVGDLFADFEVLSLREGSVEGPSIFAAHQDIAFLRRRDLS